MYFKQIAEIARGEKTCTQRVAKPNEYPHTNEEGEITRVMTTGTKPRVKGSEYNPGRLKWAVGSNYAIAPKRGMAGLWILWDHEQYPLLDATLNAQGKIELAEQGYQPLRIRIERIEEVPLQSMDETVALAEGVKSVAEYEALWRTINQRRGTRWEDNPVVWRLWFECMKPSDVNAA